MFAEVPPSACYKLRVEWFTRPLLQVKQSYSFMALSAESFCFIVIILISVSISNLSADEGLKDAKHFDTVRGPDAVVIHFLGCCIIQSIKCKL